MIGIFFIFVSLLSVSDCDEAKQSTELGNGGKENPLTWFILQQINSFSAKVDKLQDAASQREKKIDGLVKEFSNYKKGHDSTVSREDIDKLINGIKNIMKKTNVKVDKRLDNLQSQVSDVMNKATAARQGCQSGTYGEHAFPEVKFPASRYISFNPPFLDTPAIVYGLYLLDSSREQNVRVSTSISDESRNGFRLNIASFSGTVMWGARISWMACPKSI